MTVIIINGHSISYRYKHEKVENLCVLGKKIYIQYMAYSMANRTGSGLHVSDLLEILRIDRLI